MTIIVAIVLLLGALIAGLVWFAANTARKVEVALPPRGGFMEIDGERIHYVDTGGVGPAVVMIHGLGGNLLHFNSRAAWPATSVSFSWIGRAPAIPAARSARTRPSPPKQPRSRS